MMERLTSAHHKEAEKRPVMLRSLVLLAALPSTVSQFDFGLNVGNEACSMAVYEQRVVRAPLGALPREPLR